MIAEACIRCSSVLTVRTISSHYPFTKALPVKTCRHCDTASQCPEAAPLPPERPYQQSVFCSGCERNWPLTDPYGVCPVCHELTKPSHAPPMDHDEAESIAIRARFGWYLWTNPGERFAHD